MAADQDLAGAAMALVAAAEVVVAMVGVAAAEVAPVQRWVAVRQDGSLGTRV